MNPLKRIFEEYASKATIDKPEFQEKANRAARWIWSHLTPTEKEELVKVRNNVLLKSGNRSEFKEVCRRIRKRLFD